MPLPWLERRKVSFFVQIYISTCKYKQLLSLYIHYSIVMKNEVPSTQHFVAAHSSLQVPTCLQHLNIILKELCICFPYYYFVFPLSTFVITLYYFYY